MTLRALTLVVGLLGLGWGVYSLASAGTAGTLWDVEAHLLKFETYKPSAAKGILDSRTARELSACDNHSQRALLLLELPLADAALRAGSSIDFDEHMRALEGRTRKVLACAPRDSFAWLVAFVLEIEHGALNDHTFDLLAMSYWTAPDEAWIGVRRVDVAIPVVLSAPEPVRQQILAEFQNLIRRRFVDVPARAYLNASGPLHALLQARIEALAPADQKVFSETIASLRS